jgi:hypothetical protein
MAIKISGTEVIDNSRVLQNITGANGTYGNFYTPISIITTAIDFATPMMGLSMTGNVTFTESNKSAGRSAMLLLDTSSSGHTPTFSSNIKWNGGTAPTWGDARYWQIALQCIDGTTVRGTALGYETGAAPSETITLSGTSGSPTAVGLVVSFNDYARCGLTFYTDGSITQASGTSGNGNTSFGNWCNVTPSQTYYIRCTQISTTAPGTGSAGDAQPLNTWLALSSGRSFMVIDTTPTLDYATEHTVVKIEIASDSGGSNILATGYYDFEWTGLA